jgi:hypothetical protein
MTVMGTADEQMVVRAQQALMHQMTSHLEAHLQGDQDQHISQPKGGQPASFPLSDQSVHFHCAFPCTPAQQEDATVLSGR